MHTSVAAAVVSTKKVTESANEDPEYHKAVIA